MFLEIYDDPKNAEPPKIQRRKPLAELLGQAIGAWWMLLTGSLLGAVLVVIISRRLWPRSVH